MPNLTSHVATTKDHPQRLFVESVADCRNLHVPLFLLSSNPMARLRYLKANCEPHLPAGGMLRQRKDSCWQSLLARRPLIQSD